MTDGGAYPDRAELLLQLDRLVTSKHFRNSKRYPALLRFVVEQTLSGNADGLKERTLGVSVFLKPHDYDTNADPIVRVTAGEIRKRIAQYYQEPEHELEPRIDLPVGSYVPQFLLAHTTPRMVSGASLSAIGVLAPVEVPPTVDALPKVAPALPDAHVPRRLSGRNAVALLGMLLVLVAGGSVALARMLQQRAAAGSLEQIWKPLLTAGPVLIAIGVHTLDSNGQDIPPDVNANSLREQEQSMLSSMIHSEMVPVSDVVSYSRITDILTRHAHPYETLGSTETTLDQLRQGPVVLIGGLNNVWTLRLTSHLRYRFFTKTAADSGIQDAQSPATSWIFDNTQRATANSHDYAIVASYLDPDIEQRVVIIAGVGKSGTEAASEFLTTDKYLKSWRVESRSMAARNFELVLGTEILDGRRGPPRVLASYFW